MNSDLPVSLDCCGAAETGVLSADAALAAILAGVQPLRGTERVAVRQALGRVLAEDLISGIDVPAHINSAMDGYALAASDLPTGPDARGYEVIDTVLAGSPSPAVVGPGQCVRIMTGARLPAGTDTVIMQEAARQEDGKVWFEAGQQAGQNVRQAGEDLARGEVAIARGTRIGPAELGLAASLGQAELTVQRALRVAFFSSGDELRSVGTPLAAGQIYDSNRYTLYGMLHRLGAELIDMGVVRDDPAALREALGTARDIADVVITSGGVSVGDADYIKPVLAELGEVGFWKLAIKPGRPMAFGHLGETTFFGLPGNPVAVMVAFYQFVQPALRRMAGETSLFPQRFRVPLAGRVRKRPGRTEFQRGILHPDPQGNLMVRPTGAQGSGILRSMSEANCFIVLPHDSGTVEDGMTVEIEPFDGLV